MPEIVKMRHSLENISISDLVAAEESNVQITHKAFLSKLLIKGIHWDSEIETAIQEIFGVFPERGRVVSISESQWIPLINSFERNAL
jgi:hypothetical protein